MNNSNITRALLQALNWKYSIHNVKKINNGNCFHWAAIAHKAYGVELYEVFDYYGHAFVKHNDKYYDSEAPFGRDHWFQLPLYKSVGYKEPSDVMDDNKIVRTAVRVSLDDLAGHWSDFGFDMKLVDCGVKKLQTLNAAIKRSSMHLTIGSPAL